jgi:hypothetical protein
MAKPPRIAPALFGGCALYTYGIILIGLFIIGGSGFIGTNASAQISGSLII